MSQFFARMGLRIFIGVYVIFLKIAKRLSPKRETCKDGKYKILLTGTFYSNNWIISHLQPLALSIRCHYILMVASSPVPLIKKVKEIHPPKWLMNLIGKVPARLLTFFWVGFRICPDLVGGFHLLPNGLAAVLLGKMIGAKSLYFCGGGPREIIGGGYLGNRIFARLQKADKWIEKHLLEVVSEFDYVISMGSNTIDFFRNHRVNTKFYVVSGGKDEKVFYPSSTAPDIDLILVARLTKVKRVDLFIYAVKLATQSLPNITAVIVGDGPLRNALEELSLDLNLGKNIRFVGHQPGVEKWLRRSKIFVLTSESEGLPLALIEAMMCGLPSIVPKVGDIDNLVKDGINGFLISNLTPNDFANRFIELLSNKEQLAQFSKAAIESTMKYKLSNVSRMWDNILS